MNIKTYQDNDWETILIARREALEKVAVATEKFVKEAKNGFITIELEIALMALKKATP